MRKTSRRELSEESQPGSDTAPISVRQNDPSRQDSDSVARRAYQRYEARGREEGHDVEDWLSAEQELTGGSSSEGNTSRDVEDAG